MKDLEFIEELKQLIEKEEMPPPAPMEQRWTACSQSSMSPASSSAEDDIFSWEVQVYFPCSKLVGIIMHLPTTVARQRKEITDEFFHYRHLTQAELWDKYSAYKLWAKIEVPKDKDELAALQARLRKRFPVDAYNKARKELDPNRILSNNMLDPIFGNKWKSILPWLVSHFILSYPFYFWIHHMYCLLVNLLGASA
ncbi:L-galactono-1,4-lactone dehydrogenase, mitochondrial isoform X1 [Populus trichocarpa]|uniref:L-galactono-1,4-lactone dehydrogenase, mitochondrial isoform X1 n=1 Tax=Populus trichocarpa TaxID=3694 RepID=UPI002277D81B|nr:L-galactono-1,4-lactone dehydrogenase, mitochondrial isoform X1 [Populus trichocarpa]